MSIKFGRWLPTIVGTLVLVSSMAIELNQSSGAADDRLAQANPTCPVPILSRLKRHTVAPRETLDSIAQRYNLIPTTLMGLNPGVRSGQAPVGTELLIPPFNGIRVELQPNQTLRDLAKSYGVPADVLFEANGCQLKPKVAFVPGVTWSPIGDQSAQSILSRTTPILKGYPLPRKPTKYSLLLPYGWSLQGSTGRTSFHSGIDLESPLGTAVLSVGDGTVAFAGQQTVYGSVVVINHAEGLQTRYAQLGSLRVSAGQTVKQGQTIGAVGNTGRPSSSAPHLHFEVRSRSGAGWVAENPQPYLLPELSRPEPVKY
jgi:murein DD-endopeptidase MepM/ murein hydrolase activator NlpD